MILDRTIFLSLAPGVFASGACSETRRGLPIRRRQEYHGLRLHPVRIDRGPSRNSGRHRQPISVKTQTAPSGAEFTYIQNLH